MNTVHSPIGSTCQGLCPKAVGHRDWISVGRLIDSAWKSVGGYTQSENVACENQARADLSKAYFSRSMTSPNEWV